MGATMTRFQRLTLAAVAATWLLVVSGATVRVTGSGLGCPDWPLCHGHVIPPLNRPTLIEYSHRLLASAVTLLVLATAVTTWRAYRHDRAVVRPALLAVPFLAAQVILGGITVLHELPPTIVAAHLATSMAVFACLIVTAVGAFAPTLRRRGALPALGEGFALLAGGTAVVTYVLLLTGAYVTGKGAGLACRGWPLCNGELFPAGERMADIHAFHRLVAAGAGVLIAVLLWKALRIPGRHPAVRTAAAALVIVYLAQVLVGAGNVWLRLSPPVRVAHLGLAALVWGLLVALTTLAFHAAGRAQPAPVGKGPGLPETPPSPGPLLGRPEPTPGRWRSTLGAYLSLTKPRIIELLLVTTVPTMVRAADGLPSPWLMLATIAGGALCAGGANAINCYLDRDIDQVMRRTRRRSLPQGQVTPPRALAFGITLGAAGFLVLAAVANLLSAVLAAGALLFYVFVYTAWLKRRSVQNIVIGGAAGAVPPLVGWAAVRGNVSWEAVALFTVILLWTPPHFWALALRYQGDYAAAGVPMLPVVRGASATRRQIAAYSLLLVPVSLVPSLAGGAGPLYLAAAVALGVMLVREALALLRRGDAYPAMRLFHFSITYLAALFAALLLDQLARSWPVW